MPRQQTNSRPRNGNRNSYNQNRNNSDNGGDQMIIDSHNGVPAGNNGNSRTCFNCGQLGHGANQCPSAQNRPNNQNQAPTIQNNNGGQSGNRSNQNNHNNQNNQPRSTCSICGKPGHIAEDCRRNPNRQNHGNGNNNNSGNTNTHQNSPQRKQELNGIPTEGYISKGVLPQYSGSEQYCPICNRNDHFQHECENPQAIATLMFSKICCWKCCYRGHTASDCRNPQAQRCSTCQKPGHKAEDCRDRIAAALRAPAQQSAKRFVWLGNWQGGFGQTEQYALEQELLAANNQGEGIDEMEYNERVEDIAAKQIIQWPQQTQSLHHIPLLNEYTKATWVGPVPKRYPAQGRKVCFSGSNAFRGHGFKVEKTEQTSCANQHSILSNVPSNYHPLVSKAIYRIQEEELNHRQRCIRAHVDRSAKLYKKQNYNDVIRSLSCAIEEKQALTPSTRMAVLCKIAQGWQFWRDPKAMEALATGLEPRCHGCGNPGVVVDRYMRPNPVAAMEGDLLKIEDYEDWGLFAVFQCKCSNYGYSWVPRLE